MVQAQSNLPTTVDTKVEIIDRLTRGDLSDLCQAADDAIRGGGGFGWLTPPLRDVMESYWKGVLLVPDRTLIVGRLDGVIVGSAQLMRPTKNNEAQAHSALLTTSFIAPWARGHGLARMIAVAVEDRARELGVRLEFRTEVEPTPELFGAYDLVLACDGANSKLRQAFAPEFGVNINARPNKYIWLGAD